MFAESRGEYRSDAPTYWRAAWSVEEAIKLRPTFADAHLELGRLNTVQERNRDEAERALHAALRFSEAPEMEAATYFQLAVLEASRNSLAKCVPWLEAGFATGAAEPETRVACVAANVLLGRADAAMRHAETAVAVTPDYGPAWVVVGLLRNNLGEAEPGAAALAQVPELVDFTSLPTDETPLRDRYLRLVGEGLAYQRLGDATRAVEILGSILTGFLPGCSEFFPIDEIDAEEIDAEDLPQWTDLESVAQSVCNGVLVTHVGEPVHRSAPTDDPQPSEEPTTADGLATVDHQTESR